MSGPIATNRKAGFDIEIERKFEAGIVLTGDEIKSVRAKRVQIAGGYVKLVRDHAGEDPHPVVIGIHLGLAVAPERTRTLLLHKKELRELEELLSTKGKTAVALSLYLSHGWAKITVGVGRGRKQYDKREVLKRRDLDRLQGSSLKSHSR